MKITVIHESKDIIAINKPAGLVVHSDGKTKEANLVEYLLDNYPQLKDVGEHPDRPGIVHRLDRETSGVMLVAFTNDGFFHLKEQFQNRTVIKRYHAFVYGIMKENEGTIDRPITRSRKDFRLWSAQRGGRGEPREAVTDYKVLKRVNGRHQLTFVEASPKTGRTHQIRVHFKAINHPIVADSLYAPKRDAFLGFDRLALHSKEITFIDTDGKEVRVEATYPQDFEVALSKIV